MKKFLVGFAITVLLLGLGTFLWSQTPKVEDPQFVKDVLRSSEARFQALQAKASSAEDNAYLNKTFLAIWGSGAARKGGTPAENALNDWVLVAGGGDSFDHTAALEKADQEYLRARDEYLEYYPSLSEAVSKDYFVAPTATLDLSTELPDYLKVRDCAQSLTLLSQSFLAEGRKEEALRAMEQTFRFARLQEGQTMIGELIATAIREKAVEALVRDENFRTQLTAEDWARLRAQWKPERTAPERFYQVMEMETAAMLKTIDDTIAGNAQGVSTLPGIVQAGFVMEREKRMMLNLLTAQLKAAKLGRSLPPLNFSWWDWALGRSGILSAVATPAYHDLLDKFYLDHARLAGLSVAAQLQTHLLEEGKLPSTLSGLEFDAEFPQDAFELRAGKGELFLNLERERVATTDALEESKVGWRTQETDGMLFHFTLPD